MEYSLLTALFSEIMNYSGKQNLSAGRLPIVLWLCSQETQMKFTALLE